MPELDWRYAINTFEVNTRGSHVKMLSIATDTEAKLEAEDADPNILELYTAYFPVYDAYRQICINYDVQAGNRQGATLNVETMVKEDLPKEVKKWEAQVRIIYVEDSPSERAIFPNKRNPFLQGTYEDRISAVGTLAARLAADANATLTAYAPTVQSYYNLLLSARDSQQVAEGTLNALSATREQQRLLVAAELYGVLGGLMRRFRFEPVQIMRFFDMSLLRETGEEVLEASEGTIAPDAVVNILTLPDGAQRVRLTVIAGGPLELGLSADGATFNGNTTTLGSAGSVTYTIEEFASTGNIVLLRNQNTTVEGQYKIEILG